MLQEDVILNASTASYLKLTAIRAAINYNKFMKQTSTLLKASTNPQTLRKKIAFIRKVNNIFATNAAVNKNIKLIRAIKKYNVP